jgi:diadenosine tetraphosphate (Ap4A) HIT family hydrolase
VTPADADPDCDFCDIVARHEEAREVLRTGQVVAFFPLDPATLGHTLIIPKRHLPNIWHLDTQTAAVLAAATLSVAQAVRDALEPDGMNIIQSNGQAATQTVPHLHVHVVPRWHDDAMGPIWPQHTDWTGDQMSVAQARIRSHLQPPS